MCFCAQPLFTLKVDKLTKKKVEYCFTRGKTSRAGENTTQPCQPTGKTIGKRYVGTLPDSAG